MKVVLFCGGYGMRMRDGSAEEIPKPMQLVGPRPLLWHVMRYYAHFGHKDFILCLGHGSQKITEFFVNYSETASNDFVLHRGEVELLSSDIGDWRITFAHTGVESAIGERLRRVRHLLDGEPMFLANYADVLTDAPLDRMITQFEDGGTAAQMLVVPPQSSFHCVELGEGNSVTGLSAVNRLPLWENGGYFVLRQEIFDHIPAGGDLVEDGCGGLAKAGRLQAYAYNGFWQPADTIKERVALETSYAAGNRPWMLWEHPASGADAVGAMS